MATGRGGSSRSPQVAAAVAVIAARIAAVAAALRAALSGGTGRRVVSCLFPPPSASSLLFLFSQLPGRSAEQVVGARIRSLEALQDRVVDCPGPELRRVGARADCRSPLGGVSRGPAPGATPANREQTQKSRARVGRAGSATSLWRSPRDKASQLTLPTQPRRGSESQTALFVPQDSHSVDSLLGDFSR